MIPPLYFYHMWNVLFTIALLNAALCNVDLNTKY